MYEKYPQLDVSVIITSHRKKLLPTAMESVWNQTYPQDKIQMIVQYSPQYWGEKMNDAVRMSRGQYFIQLCDDDAIEPTFLEQTIAAANSTQSDFVFTDQVCYSTKNLWKARGWTRKAFEGTTSCPLPVTTLIRRTRYDSLGGYDPHLAFYDWDLFYRGFKANTIATYIPQPLFWYRVADNEGSETKMPAEMWTDAKEEFFNKHEDLKFFIWKLKDERMSIPSYFMEGFGPPLVDKG